MKQLTEKLKILQGTVITNTERDENDRVIIRKGIIQDITDNLIVVKFTALSGATFIECFNKGDLISRGTVIDRDSHTITNLAESLF